MRARKWSGSPRNKWRWRIKLLLLIALALSALAQTPQVESSDVKRVGGHIACQCGSCKETVNCPMSMSGCGFCAPAKAKILKMQKSGMSDQSIIDSYVKEYGPGIYRGDPSSFYWIVPYSALLLGVAAIFWFVRRYYHHAAPAVPVAAGNAPVDENYARYRDTIEKDLAKLD